MAAPNGLLTDSGQTGLVVEASGCVMIDWNRVADLRSEVGEDGFTEVVDLFLEETDEVIARIAANRAYLVQDLHFLKGSALNLGLQALAQTCQEDERRCGRGEAATVDTAALVRIYHDSRAALQRGIARLSAA